MRRVPTPFALLVLACAFVACAANEEPSSTGVSPSPSPSPTSNAKVVTVTITGGNIDVSETRVEVSLNQRVRIEVTSDRSEELHVHGYELKTDIKPGEPAVLEFAADLPGVFEVELEKGHDNLFELRVS